MKLLSYKMRNMWLEIREQYDFISAILRWENIKTYNLLIFKFLIIVYCTLPTNLLRYKYGTIMPLTANEQR